MTGYSNQANNNNFYNSEVEEKRRELGPFNFEKYTPSQEGRKSTVQTLKKHYVGNQVFKYKGEVNELG